MMIAITAVYRVEYSICGSGTASDDDDDDNDDDDDDYGDNFDDDDGDTGDDGKDVCSRCNCLTTFVPNMQPLRTRVCGFSQTRTSR